MFDQLCVQICCMCCICCICAQIYTLIHVDTYMCECSCMNGVLPAEKDASSQSCLKLVSLCTAAEVNVTMNPFFFINNFYIY